MKKVVWLGLTVFLFLCGISSIEAKNFLHVEEKGNGNIQLSLDLEEGYVGGIDLSVKVSGKVSLAHLAWASSISNEYTRRYYYDASNQVVRMIVTTGDQKKNLADKNGVVQVGTLVFESSNGGTVPYQLDITSLTMIDANYSSLGKKELSLNTNNQFVLDATKPVDPVVPNPPVPSEPDDGFLDTDTPDYSDLDGNHGNSSQQKPNDDTDSFDEDDSGDLEEKDDEDKKEDLEEEKKDDDTKKDPIDNNQKQENTVASSKKINLSIPIIIVTVIIAFSILGVIVSRKKTNRNSGITYPKDRFPQ